jgi:hypothetical protein
VKRYEVQQEIAAPIDIVWQVLTEEMPKNPRPFGILRIEGQIAMGATLKLWSEIAPERAFSLKVETFDRPNRMIWRGGMPFGLFVGTRTFSMSSCDVGTIFHAHEVFTGVLSGMITRSMPDLTPSMKRFSQALKSEAERQ